MTQFGFLFISVLALMTRLPAYADSESVVLDGATGSAPALSEAVIPYAKERHVGVSILHGGSEQGYVCVIENRCQIGLSDSAKPPKPDADLIVKRIAWDAVAIIANSKVTVDSVSSEHYRLQKYGDPESGRGRYHRIALEKG